MEADRTTWARLDQHMEPDFFTTDTSRLKERDKLFTPLDDTVRFRSIPLLMMTTNVILMNAAFELFYSRRII